MAWGDGTELIQVLGCGGAAGPPRANRPNDAGIQS